MRRHCFLPMFRHVSQGGQTLGNNVSATRITLGKHEMFLNFDWKRFYFPGTGRQILFPQQCFHGCMENRETFEETSRVTNVSATMFPSLPRALNRHRQIIDLLPNDKLITLFCSSLSSNTEFLLPGFPKNVPVHV